MAAVLLTRDSAKRPTIESERIRELRRPSLPLFVLCGSGSDHRILRCSLSSTLHVVRLGNDALDEVCRRVQNQTLRHRGRKHDPLYRVLKLLVSASGRITDNGRIKLRGLLVGSREVVGA